VLKGKTALPALPRGLALVLVGPEGRGKDLLIAAARRRFASDDRLAFPLRVLTRLPSASDEHLHVSRRVFRDMERERSFLVSWFAGDHGFAVPEASRRMLEEGRIVVFSGTPEAADRLAAEGRAVRTVAVNAGPDWVRGRLAAGVPLPERAVRSTTGELELNHPGNLAEAVRRFHGLLQDLRNEMLTAAPNANASRSIRLKKSV
jgi:phosphonate metabolism protein PhnN/1,5-bisphosphokinase (PRPP-forming)